MAQKIRARRDLGAAIDRRPPTPPAPRGDDAAARFAALAEVLAVGAKRLNSILGARNGVTFVRLEDPPRLRLRFRDKRVALDLDAARQLVVVSGAELDGEYQFIERRRAGADEPLEVLDRRRLPRRADRLGPAQDDRRGRAAPAAGAPRRARARCASSAALRVCAGALRVRDGRARPAGATGTSSPGSGRTAGSAPCRSRGRAGSASGARGATARAGRAGDVVLHPARRRRERQAQPVRDPEDVRVDRERRLLEATDITTLAVLRPTPGSASSASRSPGTSPPCSRDEAARRGDDVLGLHPEEAARLDERSTSAWSAPASACASGYRANSAGVVRLTRASVHCALRITAISSSNGLRYAAP